MDGTSCPRRRSDATARFGRTAGLSGEGGGSPWQQSVHQIWTIPASTARITSRRGGIVLASVLHGEPAGPSLHSLCTNYRLPPSTMARIIRGSDLHCELAGRGEHQPGDGDARVAAALRRTTCCWRGRVLLVLLAGAGGGEGKVGGGGKVKPAVATGGRRQAVGGAAKGTEEEVMVRTPRGRRATGKGNIGHTCARPCAHLLRRGRAVLEEVPEHRQHEGQPEVIRAVNTDGSL